MHAFVLHLFLCLYGQQKPDDPQFEPMADDAITQGDIRGLRSPLISVIVAHVYADMCDLLPQTREQVSRHIIELLAVRRLKKHPVYVSNQPIFSILGGFFFFNLPKIL